MNLLLVNLLMMAVGVFYFIAYIIKAQIEYLFFAVGFQVIAGQLLILLILTFVAKIWTKELIAKQMCELIQIQYVARIFSFLLFLPLKYIDTVSLLRNVLYLTEMSVMIVLLMIQIYAAGSFFRDLKALGVERNSNLKIINPEEQPSLLDTFKLTLSTSASVIAMIAALLASGNRTWFDLDTLIVGIYFPTWKDNDNLIGRTTEVFANVLGIIFLRYLVKSQTFIHKKLWLLNMCCSTQVLIFLLAAMIGLCSEANAFIRTTVYSVVTVMLLLTQGTVLLTVFSMIGQREDLINVIGFIYGLLSTFYNTFEAWIMTEWFRAIQSSTVEDIYQLNMYLIFSLVFSLIAGMLSKLLTFAQQQVTPYKRKFYKIQKRSFESQRQQSIDENMNVNADPLTDG